MKKFLKLIDSDETEYLLNHKPNAFILLTIIARRARRTNGHPDGLKSGQCYIGWTSSGLSEREYRTAKKILEMRAHLKIVETCRTRKKSTTGQTTVGTLVQLISSTVYDINPEVTDDRTDDRETTERRPRDDKQEGRRMNKKEEEKKSSSIPSPDPVKDSQTAAAALCENLSFKNLQGKTISLTSSEIYKHFLSSSYSTDIVQKAIQQAKLTQTPVSDILKVLEAICQRLAVPKNSAPRKDRVPYAFEKAQKSNAKGVKFKARIT